MTKSELIEILARRQAHLKADDVDMAVKTLLEMMSNALTEGDRIEIRGFGSFINKKRKKKIARNISRNTALVIDEHFIPSFKPAKIFINKIKNSEKVKQTADK